MSPASPSVPASRVWFAPWPARSWRCAPAPSEVRAFHTALPGYAPTPLTELPGLAKELGVGRVFVKDESMRLGLPAFKALGAYWAIEKVLRQRGDVSCFVTATDGNHGRAVARRARQLDRRAHVFVPEALSPKAIAAITAEDAEVTTVSGDYDEAVRAAARAALSPEAASGDGSALIQDTAWPGYEEVPRWIAEGYSTLFAEIDTQLAAASAEPDLVAVPVGVGSLAQAALSHYRGGAHSPALLAVEPDSAACVLESLVAGEPVTVATGTTAMAGLNCGTPSSLAWPLLSSGLDAVVTVTDDMASEAESDLRRLGVRSGPCGAATLAGARRVLSRVPAGEERGLGTGSDSTVVLVSTDGAPGMT
ncbi:pyridoxal-phosphate dependent enzyme [Prauserella marina]|uniref:pyridoxal-phosphate dependent enzyme n=1 Tax=Prauserella marina TaxID=530584 RepID=UPI001FE6204C|nr:pyridoxal-phosphate dependent enzyme [Prauserella marina]